MFLVVFIAIIPLHLIYALFFHEVFAVRELHPAIAGFPENRLVRGVGRADLSQARLWFWIIVAIELTLVPFVSRAVRRVLALDREGEVPGALNAWRTWRKPASASRRLEVDTATAAGGVALGFLVGALVWLTLDAAVDLLRGSAVGFAVAVADAVSRASGAAFALTPVALKLQSKPGQEVLRL